MKELEQKFEDILAKRCIGRGKVMLGTPHNFEVEQVNVTGFIEDLIQAVEDYFKQTGKQGGDSTKKNNPDIFSQIGKKGAAERWKKKTQNTRTLYNLE